MSTKTKLADSSKRGLWREYDTAEGEFEEKHYYKHMLLKIEEDNNYPMGFSLTSDLLDFLTTNEVKRFFEIIKRQMCSECDVHGDNCEFCKYQEYSENEVQKDE